ncbi:MAG TPA: hypothetical protein VN048_14590 [Verrucomicrobiae bacterium]|nr:hypothetical protein [Verrucomicrobiae bacterium]
MNSGKPPISPVAGTGTRRLVALLFFLAIFLPTARAEIQFDVFLGYGDLGGGGIIPEASWFPVVCEVKNDGPTFDGVIEVSAGDYNSSQTRRMVVELPTGTLKRFSIPVFSAGRFQNYWDVRLLDEHGRVRAEHSNLGPRNALAPGVTLLGALPAGSVGTPVIRQITARNPDMQPAVARFAEGAILPDNPIEWEGMDSFYLNSEEAPGLGLGQVNALLAWLNAGGHLIVGVGAVSDINATPWLHSIVPFDLAGMRTVTNHTGLQEWLRDSSAGSWNATSSRSRHGITSGSYSTVFASLPADSDFENAELLVAIGTPRNGQVLASADDIPLLITSHQGRGRVTVLLFNPERDPARSWKNLPSFWAKLTGVPSGLYKDPPENPSMSTGPSIDSVFGAMIDSKQVRKLPVEWLLLLLILYLCVIGPLDQYWLKRLKRPMLTWLTFPCYVVCFSLLIYFIGYKLRAGETEWNELHFVDVILNGDHAELRGRTYASIYSPVNSTYKVESDLHYSTFRGEFRGSMGGGAQDEHADVLQVGDNFKADIFVPVWTSQLYMSDWWQTAEDVPLAVSVAPVGQGWSVTVINRRDRPLSPVRLVIGENVYDLGEIPAATNKIFNLSGQEGQTLGNFVGSRASAFQYATQQRQSAFGNSSSGRIEDLPGTSMALSFLSSGGVENFETTPGLDLSSLPQQGLAVLLAWETDYSPVKPVNQFPTRRSHKDTLWRVAVPINSATALSP